LTANRLTDTDSCIDNALRIRSVYAHPTSLVMKKQGSILSPLLLALYVDDVSNLFSLGSQVVSLHFVVSRFFTIPFNTSDIEIVQACQKFFGFGLAGVQSSKRAANFENRLVETTAAADLY